MADEIDLAQEISERHLEAALAGHLDHKPAAESLTHCEECGRPIPEGRRQAQPGCTRCVRCQSGIEADILTHWRN